MVKGCSLCNFNVATATATEAQMNRAVANFWKPCCLRKVCHRLKKRWNLPRESARYGGTSARITTPHKGAFRTERNASRVNAPQAASSHQARRRRVNAQAKPANATRMNRAAWSQPKGVGFHSAIWGRSQRMLPTNQRSNSPFHGLQNKAAVARKTASHSTP